MVQVKICGLKDPEAVECAVGAGADYIGLVHFARSPRHVELEEAASLAARAHGRTRTVLLLVDPDAALVEKAVRIVSPDFIQLHGNETVDRIRYLRRQANRPLIKAIKVESAADVQAACSHDKVADLLLFDAKPPQNAKLPGGNGIPFDWSALKGFNTDKDYMLSGGLDADNVAAAIKITGAPVVDVSSGVESAPGVKDLQKIKAFLKAARS